MKSLFYLMGGMSFLSVSDCRRRIYAAVTISTLIHSSDFLRVGVGEGRGELRVLAEKMQPCRVDSVFCDSVAALIQIF